MSPYWRDLQTRLQSLRSDYMIKMLNPRSLYQELAAKHHVEELLTAESVFAATSFVGINLCVSSLPNFAIY